MIVAVHQHLSVAAVVGPELWGMDATLGDPHGPDYTLQVNKRTKDRGRVASVLQAIAARHLTVPYVCSGGVGDGKQLAAALALGNHHH